MTPAARTIPAGGVAGYTIQIRNHTIQPRAAVGALRPRIASALPPYAKARLVPGRPRQMWKLQVQTDAQRTPLGTYRIRLRIRRGNRSWTATVKLDVIGPAAAPFIISGAVTGLGPGADQPLDVELSNPGPLPISVDQLTVRPEGVSAPRASAWLPCTRDDFSVRQFAGPYPLVIPAFRTLALSELGIPSSDWPQVAIRDRPVDQDGCQGAMVSLSYQGTARPG